MGFDERSRVSFDDLALVTRHPFHELSFVIASGLQVVEKMNDQVHNHGERRHLE
jgi:hypothetical protein